MLDKMKDIGAQVASRANNAVEDLTATVKGRVESLTDTISEKAVRASTAQACNILETALDEISRRPIAERPLKLTATVNLGVASLQMEVQLDGNPQASGAGEERAPLAD